MNNRTREDLNRAPREDSICNTETHQSNEVAQLKKRNEALKDKLNKLTLAFDVSLRQQQSSLRQPDFTALQELIKAKDRELSSQKAIIEQLKGEVRSKATPSGFVEQLDELQARLRDSEQRNQLLTMELKHMQKVQKEQSKALEKIADENEFPARMNAMAEELRWAKERCKALESRLRHEERQSRLNVEQVVKMEETIRELRGSNTRRNSG